MGQFIQEWQVKQYMATATQMFQQRISKLRGTTRERTVVGNTDYWDRIGAVEATEKVVRHGDTPLHETPHSRRALFLRDWHVNDYADWSDLIRILTDPKSEIGQVQANAMRRRFDRQIIAAFDATTTIGEIGGSTVTFANDWSVGDVPTARSGTTGDWDFTGAALTLANVISAKTDLDKNDVDEDDRHIAISPAGLGQLLKQSTAPNVTSTDYNSVHALVSGDMRNAFLGLNWHISNLLPVPAANQRYFYIWHKSAMGVSVGKEMSTEVDKRPDKSNNWQIYTTLAMNSVRVLGEGVVRGKILETN